VDTQSRTPYNKAMPTLKINDSAIRKLKAKIAAELSPAAMNKAVGRGLSKIAKQGQTQVRREIVVRYNIKSSEVAARLSIQRGNGFAAIIGKHIKKTRIPLIKFGAKDTKTTGVTFRVKKTGKRVKLSHAFIATMPNGYTGVFERKGKHTRKIRELVGIEVVQMMGSNEVSKRATTHIEEVGHRVMMHELRYELAKAGFK
jgi:hypothetical protein